MDGFAYLHFAPIKNVWFLKKLGSLLLWGGVPVHCCLYWMKNSKFYMTELCSPSSSNLGDIIGRGDGYLIHIKQVEYPEGEPILCDTGRIELLARSYASVENGDLNTIIDEREWYSEPQGYGGPMYDRCTSNTYIYWLLKKTAKKMPLRPSGAIGWGVNPKFPGIKCDF